MRNKKKLSLLAAAAAALLLTLAMPGAVGWWPLLFIALTPLLWTAQTLRPVESGCMGMCCGMLYHAGLLYWIVIVLERYGHLHIVPALGALLLLVLYMSAYIAFFCLCLSLLVYRKNGEKGSSTIILTAAPTLWVGFDMLRGLLFTGLPWLDLGYGLYHQPVLIQAADLGGHHLITYIVVQVNALVFWLADRLFSRAPASGRRHYLCAGLIAALLYCAGGYSMMRYWQVVSQAQTEEQVAVAVVQGNIDQSEKWSPAKKDETVERYLALSAQAAQKGTVLLVWPETALPFLPQRKPIMMNAIRSFARDHKLYLLTGSPFFTVNPSLGIRSVQFFNSALMINQEGKMVGKYNKQHLVPFGEYVPLRDWLWFIKPLVELVGNFTPGDSPAPLAADRINVKAGMLICFESIFPSLARNTTQAGANLLVNLTNDAWYGQSSAPYQSWAMTVFRAVENRRSLVRAANTGISGFVEPSGQIAFASPIFVAGAWQKTVPLMTEQTVFTRFGCWFGHGCLLLLPLLLLWAWLDRRREKRRP